nr:MAG TPA: Head Tail Connector Protein [Caudoviricetes sp.]
MINELKAFLGAAADNYTEAQIGLALKMALAEVEAYTQRSIDYELEICALQIAKIKLNRLNSEGLEAQSFSGVSESYVDGYPKEISDILKRKRKIKVL